MDQREPPRMTPANRRAGEPDDLEGEVGVDMDDSDSDSDSDGDRPRLRRFPHLVTSPAVRQLTPHRLLLGVLGTIAALAVLGVLGSHVVRRAVGYVHAHPSYQLSYRDVVLDPPPPPWFRGSTPAFLDHVWRSPAEPRTFSSLDLDTDHLTLLFQWCPWVKAVSRVEVAYPKRVVVGLKYREPVAESDVLEAWVDRDGVLLPPDDIDREAVAPRIGLHGFPPPSALRYGEKWGRGNPEKGGFEPEPRVVEAAALAGFLKSRLNELDGHMPRKPSAVVQLRGERGLIVQITSGDSLPDSLLIYWGNDPEADLFVHDFEDSQKWAMLCDWVSRTTLFTEGKPVRLKFTRRGVVLDTRYGGESTTSLDERLRNGSTLRR